MFVRTVRSAVVDTVSVDQIARLSVSAQHVASGEPPRPSLWEKIVEPAILTVSSGIAIYVFFTVRS